MNIVVSTMDQHPDNTHTVACIIIIELAFRHTHTAAAIMNIVLYNDVASMRYTYQCFCIEDPCYYNGLTSMHHT